MRLAGFYGPASAVAGWAVRPFSSTKTSMPASSRVRSFTFHELSWKARLNVRPLVV